MQNFDDGMLAVAFMNAVRLGLGHLAAPRTDQLATPQHETSKQDRRASPRNIFGSEHCNDITPFQGAPSPSIHLVVANNGLIER
jgi:hypothetical protein